MIQMIQMIQIIQMIIQAICKSDSFYDNKTNKCKKCSVKCADKLMYISKNVPN